MVESGSRGSNSFAHSVRMADKLIVKIRRQVSNQRNGDTNDRKGLQRRKCAEKSHRADGNEASAATNPESFIETHLDDFMTSSRMRSNCAMTQSTFKCTPNARRKSQSCST